MAHMVRRKIAIVQATAGSMPSGGNVFNRELLRCATRAGCSLASIDVSRASEALACDLVLWDSLLLDRVRRLAGERVGLLLHYLPSLQPELDPARALFRAVEDRAAAQADCLIATGREIAATMSARWPDKPLFVCEPGVGAQFQRRMHRAPGESVQMLTVANLLPAKGHEGALRILEGLRSERWQWHLVGHAEVGGDVLARLRARAEHSGLIQRIIFHGALSQPQVAAMMAATDLLLQPSIFESYGMASRVFLRRPGTGMPWALACGRF